MRHCKKCKQNKEVVLNAAGRYYTNNRPWRGRICPDCLPRKVLNHICFICQKEFTSSRQAKYCSTACASKAARLAKS